ncbi:hypothetical protein NPIL_657811 [Nephila pilipes]|uniref:Uncharacterized protein n=1 Tax=Nephila pilipes TaxID=299642 RepID=A0A8X6I439_NEPPI|nr:hypothetical protein NPIL_657811 [Nephila pilipes]
MTLQVASNLPPIQFTVSEHKRCNDSPATMVLKGGMDFAGLFLITPQIAKSVKAIRMHFCTFACLMTKAIHLELFSIDRTHGTTGSLITLSGERKQKGVEVRRNLLSVFTLESKRNLHAWTNKLAELFKEADRNDGRPSQLRGDWMSTPLVES